MSERTDASPPDDRLLPERNTGRPDPTPPTRNDARPSLRLAVVEYQDDPDRATIHPPDSTGIDRMETWISVDMAVVVDVSAWR